MSGALHPFYPIVDSADWVNRLVPLGVKLIQLRIKEASREIAEAEILRSLAICEANSCMLILNDYWELAIDLKCEYLHLGQEDLESADMKAIEKAGLKIGLSTHDHTELERALSYDPFYVALGPIYPTTLKQLSWEPQGLAKISEWKSLIGDRPLVAIGGLSVERLQGVLDAGADVAAVSTDVTGNANPEIRASEWLKATG